MKMVKPNIRVCRCLWKVWYMGIDGGTGCGGRDEGVCVWRERQGCAYVCVRRDGCVSVEGKMGLFV